MDLLIILTFCHSLLHLDQHCPLTPQNQQKWNHIIWNILKSCTFMKIQVVFRIFKASHTRIPATLLPLPFPLGPKQVSYSPTWLGMATQGSIFLKSLQNWFVDMTLFIMAIIKHTGILPHMATICHTQLHMQPFVFSSAFLVFLLAMPSTELVLRHDPLHYDNY